MNPQVIKGRLYVYILYKGPEHPWVWVSTEILELTCETTVSTEMGSEAFFFSVYIFILHK